MTNQVVTLRPNATSQLGTWTVVGAANAHTALSDNTDSSYVQLTPRCWGDTEILKVQIPAPSLPAGAKIFSVGTRIRIQVVVGFTTPVPRCLHWHRCRHHHDNDFILGIIFYFVRWLFFFRCPKQPITAFVEQQLSLQTTNPEGTEWLVNPDFDLFEVHLGRDDSATNPLRISEVYVDVAYNQPPTATATAPTGTNTANCRPTVTWTYSDTEHDPQQEFRVVLFNSAQYGAGGFSPDTSTSMSDSGWITGDDLSYVLPLDLVNDSYRAYVKVRQVWSGIGDNESTAWSFTGWVQNVAGAPVPTFLSATVDVTQNRVLLQVQPSSSSPVTVAYNIETSLDGGVTWGPVRGGVQIPAAGMSPISLYDYEAPLNKVVRYRALGYRQSGSLRFVSAGYSNILSATPTASDFWLKDPLDPTLNSIVPLAYLGDQVTRQRSQGVFSPIVANDSNQAFKIVVNGPQYGIEGTLQLIFKAADPTDMWEAFKSLDSSGRALLLQYPTGEQHYLTFGPGTTGSDMTYTWEISPATNKVRWRKVQVSYIEVSKPAIT